MKILTSALLDRIPWLRHGFGTRLGPKSQDGMAALKQIHSSLALAVDRPGYAGEGDALITSEPDLAVSVRTADCFPILLADTANRAVAAIHAGWRGTAGQIAAETLLRMSAEFGTEPANVVAAIGPGIRACCYEVGEEVARRFGLRGAGRIDLAAENVQQLIGAGVPRDRIDRIGACTFCDSAQFYSWRRDHDKAGRMISFISAARH